MKKQEFIGVRGFVKRDYRLPHWMMGFVLLMSVLGCTLAGETVPLTPTPDLPSVVFLFPLNNASVFEGTDLTIDLLARDSTQGISRVELYVDSFTDQEPLQTATPVDGVAVPEFRVEMNWLAQGAGRHQMTALAYREDGIQSFETTIVIEVIARETPSP